MTPSAERDIPAASIPVAEQLLQDGEVILLALKPSAWFVVLMSWPVLAAAGLAAAGAYVTTRYYGMNVPAGTVMLLCLGAALARLLWGCLQWAGLLYLLTNLRVLRVRGITNPDVAFCLLKALGKIDVAAGVAERSLGVGSLLFFKPGGGETSLLWPCVARPDDVKEAVEEAQRRLR